MKYLYIMGVVDGENNPDLDCLISEEAFDTRRQREQILRLFCQDHLPERRVPRLADLLELDGREQVTLRRWHLDAVLEVRQDDYGWMLAMLAE
jgi:hypothetical protein